MKSGETEDVCVSGKYTKKYWIFYANSNLSGASWDESSLSLDLAKIVIFASPPFCIDFYGFKFNNLISANNPFTGLQFMY